MNETKILSDLIEALENYKLLILVNKSLRSQLIFTLFELEYDDLNKVKKVFPETTKLIEMVTRIRVNQNKGAITPWKHNTRRY